MATTKVIPIKNTVGVALDYIKKDKPVYAYETDSVKDIIKDSVKESDVKNVIDYAQRDKILSSNSGSSIDVIETLSTSINCSLEYAHQEMKNVRVAYNKDNSFLAFHIFQNFKEKIDSDKAHAIGKELCKELFSNFQVVISTHNNTEHTHNHIIINAVNLDGKRYLDNDKTKQILRTVSDMLCKKHGLSVLKDTEKFQRYYRNEQKKEKKERISLKKNFENSKRELIKIDIDSTVLVSKNIDDFYRRMANMGYQIKYLNSKGEYLKHIAFKVKNAERYIRGSSIGEEYSRESIENRIKNNKILVKKNISNITSTKNDIQYFDVNDYQYGKLDINLLDNNYRKIKENNQYSIIKRYAIETYIVSDIKTLNNELNNYRKIQSNQNFLDEVSSIRLDKQNAKRNYLVNQINENFNALGFIEKSNITSIQDITLSMETLYNKKELVSENLFNIKKMLNVLKKDIEYIYQYDTLKKRILDNKDNDEYRTIEYRNDIETLKDYEKILSDKKLLSDTEKRKLIQSYVKYENEYKRLSMTMKDISNDISIHDKIMNTLSNNSMINKEYRNQIEKHFSVYNSKNSKEKNLNENSNEKQRR